MTWEDFRGTTSEDAAQTSLEHLSRSHYVSIDKARRLIGYTPRYEPEEAVLEAVRWLIDNGQLEVANPLTV